MSVEIVIDLNVRVEGDRTFAGFEDVLGGFVDDLLPGVPVMVVEEESDLVGIATVERVDVVRQLIYLNVDWSSLVPRPAASADPAAHSALQRVLYGSGDTGRTTTATAALVGELALTA
jgi:hypothetical protein